MPKLNIGCGNVPLVGYTNIDKYYYPDSEVSLTDHNLAITWNEKHPDSPWQYGDAIDVNFPPDHFDEVIMVHVLEHLSMDAGNVAIKQAHHVCKPGGTIEIEVPDLTKACENFLKTPITDEGYSAEWLRIMGCLYGTQGADGEGQFHLCGYSKEYLKFKLKERGFVDIEEIPVGFGHGNSGEGYAEPEFDFRLRARKA